MKKVNVFRILLVVVFLIGSVSQVFADPNNPEGAVCPQGVIKWELTRYEYGNPETMAEFWLTNADTPEEVLNWLLPEGSGVTHLCVKTGGPGGGSTTTIDATNVNSWGI